MGHGELAYIKQLPLSPMDPNIRPFSHDGAREQQDGKPTPLSTSPVMRKPVLNPSIRLNDSPPENQHPLPPVPQDGRASRESGSLSPTSAPHSRTPSGELSPESDKLRVLGSTIPQAKTVPYRARVVRDVTNSSRLSHQAELASFNDGSSNDPRDSMSAPSENYDEDGQAQDSFPPLAYHHTPYVEPSRAEKVRSVASSSQGSSSDRNASQTNLGLPRTTLPRPSSAYTLGSELRGRTHSPNLSVGNSPGGSPVSYARDLSANRRSPASRPISYIDLLNVPYPQQVAPTSGLTNAGLKDVVGTNASLLDTKKKLELYRANVKKTPDPAVQYEFAVFLVQIYQEARLAGTSVDDADATDMLREARQILQRLADRSYPFAQYYLGDGYASGLFNKGKEDYDRAFPLFVAGSKHGHAEAGYRAALCYEFGWGTRKDSAKAAQFYRASASKGHPGAAARLGMACLRGDMGLVNKQREGLKWLKRAQESADAQYNSAPYELALLHEHGYGEDVFKDEGYAAQLFTQAAELGHPDANLRMGQAYEHGNLSCPRDPALSVHFYTGAANAGVAEAMMNLCAWYMVGAEPVLEKDENEAYEWAKKAAELGTCYKDLYSAIVD